METLQRLHNRGSVSTGYDIDNSVKLEADNSESLTRSSQDGGDRKKVTISLWAKRTELTSSYAMLLMAGVNGSKYTAFGFSADKINFHYYNSGSYIYNMTTDRVFRDTSAWYHFVVAMDTTQSTESDRVKIYVNGGQLTSFSTDVYPSQNADTPFNNDSATYPIEIGNDSTFSIGGIPYSGYLADYYLIDGQQLAPTDFGETDEDSGIWKPKKYTGSYGTNGFYLDFADASDLGDDESGNGNDFTEVNLTAADQATDTPTNNFCTFNPLQNYSNNSVFTNGATTWALSSDAGGNGESALGSIAFTKGKWYAEFKPIGTTSTSYPHNVFVGAGVMDQLQLLSTGFLGGKSNSTAQGMGYYNSNGYGYRNGGGFAWGNTYTANDIIGVALDYRSDGTAHMYVAKNGTWQNSSDPASNTSPMSMNYGSAFADNTFLALGASIYVNDGVSIQCNFGGFPGFSISSGNADANGYGNFEYAPPSGYYALCTKNLEEFG